MKPLIIITGPTAVGKTEISIRLAKAISAEIISADSIQVYKHMDVGSAKVTKDEMQGVPHYLIDELNPDEEFNITVFKEKADACIDDIYSRGRIPIIAGGTGFYIQSVLYDIKFTETKNDYEYRHQLEEIAREKGTEFIHEMLKSVDEKSANDIHHNNLKRVIRALEYYKETGKPISEHNKEQSKNTSPYNFVYFVLNDEREKMYERINKRVDVMIENGLIDEVKSLLNKGYGKQMVSMQGIGYKEIVEYLEGECTLDEAIYNIKINTRHFAKRQLTWFRREKDVTMIFYPDYEYDKHKIVNAMIEILKNKNII